jgi:predicted PurR-regulated permease PerM
VDTKKVSVGLLGVLVVIALGGVFKITSTVLQPLVIALLLSFVLSPLVEALAKLHVPRILALIVVILLVLGLCYLIGLFVYSSVQSFVRQYGKYQDRLVELFYDLWNRFDLPEGLVADINWTNTLRSSIVSFSGSFMSFMSTVGIIIIFLIFLLLERPYFRAKLEAAFQSHTRQRIGRIIDDINQQMGRYLTVKLFASALTGVCAWVALTLIGLDFPLVWGAMAFLFNFIPSIGSAIVVVATILLAIVQFYPSWQEPFLVASIMFGINLGIGNFLEPKLHGDQLNLSPFLVLFSLIFWGWLWGIVGMFLAVPLTVSLKILCENVPALKPASVLMGTGIDRPAGRLFRRRHHALQREEEGGTPAV